jgi:ribosomal protein L28
MAKTNLTGTLTQAGGSTSHFHAQSSSTFQPSGGSVLYANSGNTYGATAVPPYFALAYIMKG